nr:MAG TPA: hypothetical protein [Caudoviricetes sp.]
MLQTSVPQNQISPFGSVIVRTGELWKLNVELE